MVRIVSLHAEYDFPSDFRGQVRVFAVAFPLPGPGRLTAHVQYRVERPGNASGTCFIGGYFARTAGQIPVEGSCHIDPLREQRAVGYVGRSVDLVYSV